MKGFTLIELLAVIVILAIILIIAVPTMNNIIEGVKKSAFESSVKNIVNSGEYTYANSYYKDKKELVFTFEGRNITANYPDYSLEFNGEVPISGNLIIREDGKIATSLFNGDYCATKDYNENKVTITDLSQGDCYSEISLPSIFLNGTTPEVVEIPQVYNDLGVYAESIYGEEITTIDTKILKDSVEVSSIDTNSLGNYRIIYTVYEAAKMNYVERVVNVVDTTKPSLVVPGTANLIIADVDSYDLMSGVSVTDNSGETLTVTVTGSIAKIAGSYNITYTATDSSGNTESIARVINVSDISAPVITLNGASTITLNVGATYTELGATASDDADGNLTSSIVTTGTVNTNIPGTYYITYTVTDSSNNESNITRTINVIDNVLPVVTFGTNGNATYAKTRSTTVNVSDLHSGVASRYYMWTTSTTAPSSTSFTTTFTNGATLSTPAGVTGGYYLWIKAVDSSSNEIITRTNVFNIDNTNPTVTFGTNGNTTYAKTRSTTVSVSDANSTITSRYYMWTTSTTAPSSASFTTTFTNGATLSTPAGVTGGYYLWIKAVDSSSNEIITRTNVFNLDNTKPVITLTGSSSIEVDIDSVYTDPGYTATDNVNGTITGSVVISGTVNTAVLGTYTLTYNVTDSSGNTATAVTRTVVVKNLILKATGTAVVSAADTISVTGLPFQPVLVVVSGTEYQRVGMLAKAGVSFASTPKYTTKVISSNWETFSTIGYGSATLNASGFNYTLSDGGTSTFGEGKSVTWYAYNKVVSGTATVDANERIVVSGLGFTPSVVVVSGTAVDFYTSTAVASVSIASTPLITTRISGPGMVAGTLKFVSGTCSKYAGGFTYTIGDINYPNAKFGQGSTVTWYAYE